MKDILIDVVKSIVDKPDEVSIEITESENTQIFELRVGEGDVGKVIGKHGKNVGLFVLYYLQQQLRKVEKERY